MVSLDEVTAALEKTSFTKSGISFAGKSLKLNSEEDAKQVVDAINGCKNLQYLNLEGNTLGVEASRAIAAALEKHPEFQKALWKDMFTGRMKTEIPKALEYLGNGLVGAGSQLTELDLSDNAFGPIGVEGLASLLRSSSCYALEELRLNNNGLGITGGKLLSKALLDCYECSKKQGKPLALKVFIAGRNRLENDGAKALAEVFNTIGTLEEIAMPQNGIYFVGITALSEAFKNNRNLEILNLNDNTMGPKGSVAIANVLPHLENLKEINFGDCLIKNKGARYLAQGLRSCMKLQYVTLSANEIRTDGALELIDALSDKDVQMLVLDGNQFGTDGIRLIRNELKEIGKVDIVGSLSEDESADSEDEDEDSNDDEPDEDEYSEEENGVKTPINNSINESKDEVQIIGNLRLNDKTVTVLDFLNKPNQDNFTALGSDISNLLITEAKKNTENYLENLITILMKVGSLNVVVRGEENIKGVLTCCEQLFKELFVQAQNLNSVSIVNNSLLVNLGLIKSEDKKFKPTWNIDGCLIALQNILKKNFAPESTKDSLRAFMQKEIDNNNKDHIDLKKNILLELK